MAAIMNKIIDIHNHSLPLVDDGAKSFDEAIENITYLKTLGINDIILTSHHNPNIKSTKKVEDRLSILEELKLATKSLNVNLYLGNEVFVNDTNTLRELLNNRSITTLNNSKYLLLELPFSQKVHHIENIICELNELGITPIIAHPERYFYYDIADIKKLLEYNCLIECNLTSLVGCYGSDAKKKIKKYLKNGLVSFLATDFHHYKDNKLEIALKKLTKYITEEEKNNLLYNNPLQVLQNNNI